MINKKNWYRDLRAEYLAGRREGKYDELHKLVSAINALAAPGVSMKFDQGPAAPRLHRGGSFCVPTNTEDDE